MAIPPRRRPASGAGALAFGCALLLMLAPGVTRGQDAASPAAQPSAPLRIGVSPGDYGLAGWVRPGGWTPLRLALNWSGEQPVEVELRWSFDDGSGDPAWVRRTAALTPGREQEVWLYAPLPLHARPDRPVTITAVDPQTEQPLGEAVVVSDPARRLAPSEAVIGVMSARPLGLGDLERHETQHERIVQAQGLSLESLPDRWQGLSLVETLVWTAQGGGDPLSTRFTPKRQDALRDWVRRGGDLILFWPEAGEGWLRSGVSDLLPVGPGGVRRGVGPVPAWADGTLQHNQDVRLAFFTPDAERGGQAVLSGEVDGENRVLGASRRYGFGRVTVIGLDVTSAEVASAINPGGFKRLWKRLIGWTGPIYAQAVVDAWSRTDYRRSNEMRAIQLGSWIDGRVAMTGSVSVAIALGVLLLMVYWLVAGPVAYAVLKAKGKLVWSWPVFAGAAVVFSGIAWAGAYLLRPAEQKAAHVSVVDLDSTTGQARVRSWAAVYLPRFGEVELSLAEDPNDASSAAGGGELAVFGGLEAPAPGLLRRQPYALDAASPSAAGFGFRATTQRLRADWMGPAPDAYGVTSSLRVAENLSLAGTWSHAFPGTLRQAIAVYCPRAGSQPVVYELGDVEPGRAVVFDGPANAKLSPGADPDLTPRRWKEEGWLGVRAGKWMTGGDSPFAQAAGAAGPQVNDLAGVVDTLVMASFFDRLPYPVFKGEKARDAKVLHQPRLRGLDLSHLLDGRRVVILGALEGAPLPAPLRVDGQALEQTDPRSLTWVRWIGEPAPPTAGPTPTP
ncbi:MAG: hypothetical protein AAGA57_11245 [Planctomycetota bacterium]